MAYQVIARKWRPQTFEEVTGQEPITRTLRGAIEHDRLHHAYLFSGARGVGKTTTARLLAKALNCHKFDHPTPTPCKITDPDVCPSCREIAEGRSIDVLEIDAASNTGVDNVREAIINTVGVRPARDRFKVFIIDEVHMLSGAAFNALLKTLEEPPPRVVFIMATTELHKVPDTILSRCQQFEFRTIATQKIAERLRLIADAEKIKVDDEALYEIARAGEGSMRDAQSAFDQVISFSEDKITTTDVEAALGLASAEQLARVVAAIANENPAEALAVVDDLVMRGHDLRNFCRDLLAHLRDLLVARVGGDGAEASAAARRDAATSVFSESDLVRFFHSLTETERALREGAHPRYQLEVGLVKLIEMRRLAPINQIIERLNALEEALRTGRAPLGSAGSSTSSSGSGGAAPRGGGRPAPPTSSRTSTPRAEGITSALPPAAQTAASSGNTPAASSATQSTSATHKPNDPFDWSAYTTGATTEDAPFWDRPLASDQPTTAPQTTNTPAQTSAAQSSAANSPALRLVAKPDAQSSGAGARSFASRGWRVPGRDDVPDAPPETTSAPRGDSITEQIKHALETRRKPLLATALDGARKAVVDGDEFYVEFAPERKHLRDSLGKPENMKLLREVCRELLGRDVGVRVVVKDASESDAPPTREDEEQRERQQLRELAEKHPAVQHLLRTFRAEIVDVRRVSDE